MSMTLKAARVNRGLTGKEAAEALGISAATLFQYEAGNTYPNVLMIQKIEDLYQIKYDQIIFLADDAV